MEFTMQLRKTSSKSRIKLGSPAGKLEGAGGSSSSSSSGGGSKNRNKKSTNCRQNQKCCVCMPPQPSNFEFPLVWKELRTKKQLCDGLVRCLDDGTEFKIHRAILSASSSYFRVLFTNSINGGDPETYEANINAPSEIFALILDYAYSGACTVNASNVEMLVKVADQYEVLGVVRLCCKFLLDGLCPANCLGILQFAEEYFCQDLIKRGLNFVKYNFTTVMNESDEFGYLNRYELARFLSDDELNVKNEEIVFNAAIKWIQVHPASRKCHLLELLKCVRLGNLSRDCIQSIMAHHLIEEQPECLKYLISVLELIDNMACGGNVDIKNILFRPRVSYDVLFAIGGWTAGSPTNFVETYDVRADRWLLSSDTDSVSRAYHGLCTLNGSIYVIGGFDGSQYFNTMRRFDPITHTWNECACMYYHRCYVSAVMCDSKIYAMGGYNGRVRMNTAERYDPSKNQWEVIQPMLKPRSDASAAALNDKIYIVGGFNGQEVMKSAEMFNVKTNQWSYIPQMTTARSGVSLVVFDNALYALGGFNGYARLTTGEKLTPGDSSWWTDIAEMVTPRSNFATAILDDFIYVIGGFNGSSTVNFVEYYDPETDEWFDASSMNLNRSALSACVISGLPNAKEYSVLGRSQQERGQGAETSSS